MDIITEALSELNEMSEREYIDNSNAPFAVKYIDSGRKDEKFLEFKTPEEALNKFKDLCYDYMW